MEQTNVIWNQVDSHQFLSKCALRETFEFLKIFNYVYRLRQSPLFFNLTRPADHPARAYIYHSQSVKSRVDVSVHGGITSRAAAPPTELGLNPKICVNVSSKWNQLTTGVLRQWTLCYYLLLYGHEHWTGPMNYQTLKRVTPVQQQLPASKFSAGQICLQQC